LGGSGIYNFFLHKGLLDILGAGAKRIVLTILASCSESVRLRISLKYQDSKLRFQCQRQENVAKISL
jgi:hypothetical protein